MRPAAVLLLSASAAYSQAVTPAPKPATPPVAISAYYRLPGQGVGPYPYRWMVLDPPLSFSVDNSGTPHLGVNIALTFGRCTLDAFNNLFCSDSHQVARPVVEAGVLMSSLTATSTGTPDQPWTDYTFTAQFAPVPGTFVFATVGSSVPGTAPLVYSLVVPPHNGDPQLTKTITLVIPGTPHALTAADVVTFGYTTQDPQP